jgi:superfamily I DNA and/or RNA helicase
MHWLKELYTLITDKPISEKEIGEIISKVIEEYKKRPRVFCKDCINICKPAGAPYEPHPESICLTGGTINYITGETEHWLCKYQNSEGLCQYYTVKNNNDYPKGE